MAPTAPNTAQEIAPRDEAGNVVPLAAHPAQAASARKYRFRFARLGGVDQVVLSRGEDLAHLPELDLKLWAALAMPTRGVDLDPRTVEKLDVDKDGRVRAPEILESVRWTLAALRDADLLFTPGDSLPLSALAEGPLLVGSRRALESVGKSGAGSVSLADVAEWAKIFAATRLNGDGIMPADCASDDATRKVIEEIIGALGAATDRSGKPGIDRPKVEAFFAQARAWCDWRAQAEENTALMPAGPATEQAERSLAAVEAAIEDYFTRCRLAAFAPSVAAALGQAEAHFAKRALERLSPGDEELARLPLSRVEPGRPLPLGADLNPACAAAMEAFRVNTVAPLLGGKGELTEADWGLLREKLAAFRAWKKLEPQTPVEKLGWARLREILAGGAEQALLALIDQDLALKPEYEQISSVEKLLLFRRDLVRVLNNTVNFSDFYRQRTAVFQAGTLWLDGRTCELCLEVSDAAKQSTLAAMSATCLVYCDCTRPGGEKTSIVAAMTNGESDNLFVGRNGVYYDRRGRDWDAAVTKIVSNPISVREAFWSPYRKFVRMLEEQFAKRAAAAEADSHAQMAAAATDVAHADKTQKAPPKKIDVGTVAAIGVAVGGIGAMVSGLLAAFFGLGWWMPVGLMVVPLLISGPSMLLAWLKLRQRNLGPVLDACGWAINGRAKINVPFGAALTRLATLPPGSERLLRDPFAEKRRPWAAYLGLVLLLVLAALWYLGRLDPLLPTAGRSVTVMGANAPAYVAPPAAPAPAETQK